MPLISRRRSSEFVGVRMRVSAFSMEVRRVDSIAADVLVGEVYCRCWTGRTCEGGRLHADEIALDRVAETHSGFAGDVLAEEMLFHGLEGLGEVFFCECLAANDVSKVSPDCAETGANDAAGCCCRCLVLFSVLLLDDGVHLLVEVLEHELALCCLAPPCVLVDFLELLRLGVAIAEVRLRVVQHHVAVLLRSE